jgi:hypothetical protein
MKTFYEVEFGNCEFRVYGEAIPRKVGFIMDADSEHAAIAKAKALVEKIGDDCDWVLGTVTVKGVQA